MTFCTCPDWDQEHYGPPFLNICVACGKPIQKEEKLMEERFEKIERLLAEANSAIAAMMDGQSMEFKVLVPLFEAVDEMATYLKQVRDWIGVK